MMNDFLDILERFIYVVALLLEAIQILLNGRNFAAYFQAVIGDDFPQRADDLKLFVIFVSQIDIGQFRFVQIFLVQITLTILYTHDDDKLYIYMVSAGVTI